MVFQRYLLLSDVHGNVDGVQKLLRARYDDAKRKKFDAIIISGDFPVTTPLNLVLTYMLKNHNLSRLGYSTKVYREELRQRFIAAQILSIKRMMASLLKFDLPIMYIPGNIETLESISYFKKNFPQTIFLDNDYCKFNEKINFFGLGGSLDHHGVVCDHEFPESYFTEKTKILAKRIASLDEKDPLVFVFHEPPAFTLAQSDIEKMKRKAKKRGYAYDFTNTAGSTDLHTLITTFSPRLVLNGHFHEYQGVREINNSPVINPGALATYNYAIVSIDFTKIKIYEINFFKIRPSPINFTNFLYQKRNFILTNVKVHS